jgi:hypothetical protein
MVGCLTPPNWAAMRTGKGGGETRDPGQAPKGMKQLSDRREAGPTRTTKVAQLARPRVKPAHSRQPKLGPHTGEPFCSPQQGLPAKAGIPIVVRAGLIPFRPRSGPPARSRTPSCDWATSGGATLLGAIPRPNTRLTTRPRSPPVCPVWPRTHRRSGYHSRVTNHP